MATITIRVPDEDLAAIDAAAGGNRTQFMLAAALEAAERYQRARLDAEVSRILREDADRDRTVLDDLSGSMADGLA